MGAGGKVLVVGASGFIGRALVALMESRGLAGTALSRTASGERSAIGSATVANYEDRTTVAAAAAGCDVAVMLAGRAHVLKERECDPEVAFLRANCAAPLAVAEAFAAAGGRRFVFISSIAVNGAVTPGRPFRAGDSPAPVSAYGRSKLRAEQMLAQRCPALGLELVVIRPPLVYGAGAPGNFGLLLRAAACGVPLPLGSIRNRRHFVGVENLVDLVLLTAHHAAAADRTFLVSDREPLSTPDFVRLLYRAAGRAERVVPFPPRLLRSLANALGCSTAAASLIDDLLVDAGETVETLGWQPPFTTAEGLTRCFRGPVT